MILVTHPSFTLWAESESWRELVGGNNSNSFTWLPRPCVLTSPALFLTGFPWHSILSRQKELLWVPWTCLCNPWAIEAFTHCYSLCQRPPSLLPNGGSVTGSQNSDHRFYYAVICLFYVISLSSCQTKCSTKAKTTSVLTRCSFPST